MVWVVVIWFWSWLVARFVRLFVARIDTDAAQSVPQVQLNFLHHYHTLSLRRIRKTCSHVFTWPLSGDVEENPGPFTQINNDQNAPSVKEVNSVSLLESRLSELGRIPVMETVFSVQPHASYITPLSIICIIRSLGVQHVLHYPELYIDSKYEYSW